MVYTELVTAAASLTLLAIRIEHSAADSLPAQCGRIPVLMPTDRYPVSDRTGSPLPGDHDH